MGNQANPQRALKGRYSCKAQGASPGLIIEILLLSPKGAALSQRMQSHKPNARTESAAPTELLFFVYVFTQGSVRAFGTLATLGFAGVSCLRHSHQHRPINPTTNANNDTNQPINPTTSTNNDTKQ